MRWRKLLSERGAPIPCPECGGQVGELVDGVAVQRHGGRFAIGAYALSCGRGPRGRECPGVWVSAQAAAKAAAAASQDAADALEAARIAHEAAIAVATAAALVAKRLADAARESELS